MTRKMTPEEQCAEYDKLRKQGIPNKKAAQMAKKAPRRIVQIEGDASKAFNDQMMMALAKHTLKH